MNPSRRRAPSTLKLRRCHRLHPNQILQYSYYIIVLSLHIPFLFRPPLSLLVWTHQHMLQRCQPGWLVILLTGDMSRNSKRFDTINIYLRWKSQEMEYKCFGLIDIPDNPETKSIYNYVQLMTREFFLSG